MAEALSLLDIKRQAPEVVLKDLRSTHNTTSREAGIRLVKTAASFGISIGDYLTLAIDPRMSSEDAVKNQFKDSSGFETALALLQLPVRQDFRNGITLALAAQTFQTYEGTRALFPEVIDQMIAWGTRQQNFEDPAALIFNSRTIQGSEVITTIMDPDNDVEARKSFIIPEGGKIPVRTVKSTQRTVGIYKHGSGYETTYEFERRASLDILRPFANRVLAELMLSKNLAATYMLLNGDASNPAATVVKQSAFGGTQSGKIEYIPFLKWLVSRAQIGRPVDTVVGNWDAYVMWLVLFGTPNIEAVTSTQAVSNTTAQEALARMGVSIGRLPFINFNVNFALSSAMPAGRLLGYSKGDTLEELREANADITEMERIITNQTINYTRTENVGYKLAFGDTRQAYDYTTP